MNKSLGVSISKYKKQGDSFLDDIIYGKKNPKPCLDNNFSSDVYIDQDINSCLKRKNLVDVSIRPHIVLEPDNIFVAKSKNITIGYMLFSNDPYFKEKSFLLGLPTMLKAGYKHIRGQYTQDHFRNIKNILSNTINTPRSKLYGAVNFSIKIRKDFRSFGIEKYMLDILEYTISDRMEKEEIQFNQIEKQDIESTKIEQIQYSKMFIGDDTYFEELYANLGFDIVKTKLNSPSKEIQYVLELHRKI